MGSGLREGWEIRKLGEVCDIYNGSTPLRTKKEYWDDGTISWFTINDIRHQGRIIEYTNQKISQDGFKNSSLKILPINTILLCCTASVGEFALTKIELTTNQQFNGLVIKDKNYLLPEYLFYFSSTLTGTLLKLSGKATIDFVSMTKLKKIQIPIPPLQEQKKIVALLDEAFLAIERAKENTKTNLQNAKELFESYLQSVFENRGEDWEEKTLENLTEVITKGSSPKWQGINYIENNGILFITSENVGNGKLILKKRKYLEVKFNDIQKKSILKKGDVLTNIVGASIGRTAMYTIDDIANINQAVCIIRCKSDKLDNYYLMNILNSPFFKKILHENEVNNARANLSLTFFKNLIIPFPPLTQQTKIVKKLNAIQEETKKLEAIYTQKLADLEELKKSLLQKAFNGELV